MRHFIFETKNLLLTRKFLIILGVIIGLISLLFLRNYMFQSHAENLEKKELERIVKFHRDLDYSLEIHLMENDGDKQAIERKEINELILEKALIWSSSFNQREDWKSLLQKEIDYLQSLGAFIEAEEELPLSLEEIDKRLLLNEELLKRNIPPEYENYSIAIPNFLKQVFDFLAMYGMAILLLLLISDVLATEFENRTILFQFTQPINRSKIIFSKYFASIFMFVIVLVVIFLTSYVNPALFGRQGDFHFPVFIERNNELQPISIYDYLLSTIISIVIFSLLIISLYLLFSLITKHTLLTLFSVICLSILGAILAILIPTKTIALINPFRYFLSMNYLTFQTNQYWYDGFGASIFLTILCLFLAAWKIRTAKIE